MMPLPAHQPTHERRACARSGLTLGAAACLEGLGPSPRGTPCGYFEDPEHSLVTARLKGVSPHFAHRLHPLAVHLAAPTGELDTATLAEALGQDPAHPTAAAYRAVARDALDRLTAAGLLIRRGRRPAFFWTLP